VAAAAVAAPLVFDLLPLPKVPPMVTEIIAGILIGPHVLKIAELDDPVVVLSQIGLVFLFFLAGLEIAFDAQTSATCAWSPSPSRPRWGSRSSSRTCSRRSALSRRPY
jgi:predicted Kef-type K+ transport protein